MKTPLQRIRTGAGILASVSLISIVGYILITPGHDVADPGHWLDAIDWFVFTVSTVGFTEQSSAPPEFKAFRIIVIVIGITAVGYTIGGLIQMMTEGEIERAMGLRRMSREIALTKGHVIVCGFGRIGVILAEALTSQKLPFVVIDEEPDRISEAEHLNYLVVSGDATEESVLNAAGLDRAETFISALGSDAANVFLTLTAHTLNPNLRIIARGESPRSENKLRHAGADEVVLPAVIGARRMATMITQPRTAELFDRVTDHKRIEVKTEEIDIPDSSPLVNTAIRETDIADEHRLLIVAVQRQADGELVFNPEADYAFAGGDTIILMGKPSGIMDFRKRFKL